MGLGAVRCESYSGVLEAKRSHEMASADDFSLGEDAKEKLIYATAIGATVAWAGYWIISTPTYSEMCGQHDTNNQSNANTTENMSVEKEVPLRCKQRNDDGIAIPPLTYAHYP